MNLQTCLLITDDPDDHQAFSEALSEVSANAIVLIVLDSEKASDLLKSRTFVPNYIFLDMSMNGIRINTFLNSLQGNKIFKDIPTVVYGDPAGFKRIEDAGSLTFFNKNYDYSELKDFLGNFFMSDAP
jgi:CheY-like chemotaxis protein